jgi:hypothetical protein
MAAFLSNQIRYHCLDQKGKGKNKKEKNSGVLGS